jgi:hypothetical protein
VKEAGDKKLKDFTTKQEEDRKNMKKNYTTNLEVYIQCIIILVEVVTKLNSSIVLLKGVDPLLFFLSSSCFVVKSFNFLSPASFTL